MCQHHSGTGQTSHGHVSPGNNQAPRSPGVSPYHLAVSQSVSAGKPHRSA
jgi:hypothetical protein